jgi:pilus assembly protein CpaE
LPDPVERGNMQVVIATDSPEFRDFFRHTVLSFGLDCFAEDCVALDGVRARLAQGSADLLLVVIGNNVQGGLDAIQFGVGQANIPVIVAGPMDDARVIVHCLRAGAREYIDQMNARDELAAALEKAKPEGVPPKRHARIIAVTAATPGGGVTTAASGLAFALARQDRGTVLLAEIGNGVPELALALDVEPRNSVGDLIRDYRRMDTTMLRHTLVEHPTGIQVLAYPLATLTPGTIEIAGLKQLLLLVRKTADIAILDVGHVARGPFLEVLLLADCLVLVTRLDIPGLRMTRQYLHELLEAGIPQGNINIVANRYGQRRQLAWRKAEEALGLPMRGWLSDDTASINDALNHGQPLVQAAPRANLTRQFEKLARELAPRNKEEPAAKKA